jgi:hypothetical protein
MQREFQTTTDVRGVIEAAVEKLIGLPDWDDLSDGEQQRLTEVIGQDDLFLDLLVLREATYDRSNQLEGDQPEEEILGSESFRAAEWLDATLRLFVGAQAVEILETDLTAEEVFTAGGISA